MANILQEGFRKLMRYAQNLAEYNKAIQDGIIDENVFVIVLEEKVAKFKGQTFDWSGGVDLSLLATKEELAEAEEVTAAALNELNDRIIEATENFITKEGLESDIAKVNESIVENEEIIAAALNDLDNRKANKEYVNDLVDRKADKEYVEDALANLDIDIDTSTLVTKDEFAEVEEVWSASYNQLIQKVADVQQYIYNEAASRRQFDEAIAEIEAIIAENESVITAAWNQLKTRIDALEAALRQGE